MFSGCGSVRAAVSSRRRTPRQAVCCCCFNNVLCCCVEQEREELKQRERQKRSRRMEVISTLAELGYSRRDAATALHHADGDVDKAYAVSVSVSVHVLLKPHVGRCRSRSASAANSFVLFFRSSWTPPTPLRPPTTTQRGRAVRSACSRYGAAFSPAELIGDQRVRLIRPPVCPCSCCTWALTGTRPRRRSG